MMKKSAAIAAVALGLVLPGTAMAEALAFTTTDLNIRTGPAATYQRFGTIRAGDRVTVHGCLSGYNWCDVSWAGERGWVSGSYLAYAGERHARRPIPSIGLSIGLPVISFTPEVYHRRYYVNRPWYRDRFLGRSEVRRDRRELHDARRDVREQRRDLEKARQDLQRDRRLGRDTRDERREVQNERRDLRDAQRDLRRERRD